MEVKNLVSPFASLSISFKPRLIHDIRLSVSTAAKMIAYLHPLWEYYNHGDEGCEENSEVQASAPNSIAVFFNTPRFVIPYQFFDTSAVSSISSEIRRRNSMDFVIRRITGRTLEYGHVIKISRVALKKAFYLYNIRNIGCFLLINT